MKPVVREMVAATYVLDIGASRAFYELLGFSEQRSGAAPTAAWSVLSNNGYMLLLVSTEPPVQVPALPLLFDFFVTDLDATVSRLSSADYPFDHQGHPQHALGGEVKVLDPDGNTILLGQRLPSWSRSGDEPTESRFSLLKEAAALAAAGRPADHCPVREQGTPACPADAEVKLADSSGDSIWVCLAHADEILVSVPGTFIASPDNRAIATFLAARGG
jgi:hypothetical protein